MVDRNHVAVILKFLRECIRQPRESPDTHASSKQPTTETGSRLSRFEVAGRERPALHLKQCQSFAGCAQRFSPDIDLNLWRIAVV
jgi:hypothetical protein